MEEHFHRLRRIYMPPYRYKCIECGALLKIASGVILKEETPMKAIKVYRGMRNPDLLNTAGEVVVTVNEQLLPLAPSLKICKHSPGGFNWGYGGSGPAQLALAILLDYLGDKAKAFHLHQEFKWKIIAPLPAEKDWELTGDQIDTIVREIEERRKPRGTQA